MGQLEKLNKKYKEGLEKMKTVKEITPEQCQALILNPDLDQLGYYPGCLLDNYLLYDCNACMYIIIQEKYLNEWSSTLVATKTNDRKLVDDFLKTQDEVLNEINAE